MTITVHGTEVELDGKQVKVGQEAPAARVKTLSGSDNVIGMIAPTSQLFLAIPSLKTEVCSLGAKKFNDLIKEYKKLKAIVITTDDKEFLQSYADENCLENLEIVIDEGRSFAKKYGVLIKEGKLKDRLARAAFVVDQNGIVSYYEVVPEVVNEVNYDACIDAVDEVVNLKKKGHVHEDWMRV